MGADGGGEGGGQSRGGLSDGAGRLTADGQAFVAAWVAEHGSGVGLLRRLYGSTWRRAMAVGMTVADVERCCEDATVLAATRFDPAKGKFVTILCWYIRAAVQNGIDERLGYWDGSKHKPTRVESLDAGSPEDGFGLHDLLPAPGDGGAEGVANRDAADALREAIRRVLPKARDREILELRYGLTGEPPLTMKEAGQRFGVSRARVEQIQKRALAKLRKVLPADLAETILGA